VERRSAARSNGNARHIDLENAGFARLLIGERGSNMKLLEKLTGAEINARGNRLLVGGAEDATALALRALRQLYELVEKGFPVAEQEIQKAVDMLKVDRRAEVRDVFMETISIPSARRQIAPRSPAQKSYVQSIREHHLVFAVGPAGTGKTYLAVAMAVQALLNREYKRIVLARPAVEAGEKLGFLPGDIAEKVNPYLRPLYDSLEDMMDIDRVRKYVERGVIEIAPLAFMRGRTLNDSFVILDEAQNTTPQQMKMFLTRLGFNSRAVITGDVTQVDLPPEQQSGLVNALETLGAIKDVGFCHFTSKDVVRHPLVAKIIEAYDKDDERRKAQANKASAPPEEP
jgi:phosphate starvation-inducible protein PhoH and related proteins